jgi:hypothetical protein
LPPVDICVSLLPAPRAVTSAQWMLGVASLAL